MLTMNDWDVVHQMRLFSHDYDNNKINEAVITWWHQALLDEGCEDKLADNIIRSAIALVWDEQNPSQAFADKMVYSGIFYQETIDKFRAILNNPVCNMMTQMQLASHKLFYSWRKYFRFSSHKFNNRFYLGAWYNRKFFGYLRDGADSVIYAKVELRVTAQKPTLNQPRLFAQINFGGEDATIGGAIGLGILCVYGEVYVPWVNRQFVKLTNVYNNFVIDYLSRKMFFKYTYGDSLETGIGLHHGCLWLRWFSPAWNGRPHCIHLNDLILGKQEYNSWDICTLRVEIPLPEKVYAGTARVYRQVWRRDRIGSRHESLRCEIDINEGIPIPGKGENPWDCDDDRIYGKSILLDEFTWCVDRAVEALVRDVLDTRNKYGGDDWKAVC